MTRCKECVYSKMSAQSTLRCHRLPPTPILVGMTDNGPAILAVFPTVQPDMSCGEGKLDPMVPPQTALVR